MAKNIGFFDDDSREFVVTDPMQKKYQDNFLFNENFVSYVTHTGMGYSRYIEPSDDYSIIS